MPDDFLSESYLDTLNQVQPWLYNSKSGAAMVNGRVLRASPGFPATDKVSFYDVVLLDQSGNDINLNRSGTGNPVRPYLLGVRSSTALTAGDVVQVHRGTVSSLPGVTAETGVTEDYFQVCPSNDHMVAGGAGGGGSCYHSYLEWGAFFESV